MKKNLLQALTAAVLLCSCNNSPSDQQNVAKETTEKSVPVIQPKPPHSAGIKRILMVGNSHTEYFISLPDMLEALCKGNGQEVKIDKLVEMGVSISETVEMNKAAAAQLFGMKDADGNYYDYIILQEKTPIVLDEPDLYAENCKILTEMAKTNSPGAAIYIYELMSPYPYTEREVYSSSLKLSLEHAEAVARSLHNTGVLYIGDKIEAAYSDKKGYQYMVDGKDALRFGESNLHMLNDAGFLSSIYMYKTLFGTNPEIPAQLPFSTGTGDEDGIALQEVQKMVSNPEALKKIAQE